VELNGSEFDDLDLAVRRALMTKAGADVLVTVRVMVGGYLGAYAGPGAEEPNQRVEVQLELTVDQGDRLVWASRCSAAKSDSGTVCGALERAARCAVGGAMRR
jgi:hypothetical protein